MELNIIPKHNKGIAKGENISFYYIPNEQRVQFLEPALYEDYVKLVPSVEHEALLKKYENMVTAMNLTIEVIEKEYPTYASTLKKFVEGK